MAVKADHELTLTGVQEILEREGEQLVAVPPSFIRPLHERPGHLQLHIAPHAHHLPIVDVSGLLSPHSRPRVLHEISHACTHWGFFQAINHGVSDELVAEMRATCLRFFNQPAEERNKFRSQNLEASVAYSTSFNPSMEVTRDWKDVLYVRDIPGVCSNGFNIAPEICRKAFTEYRRGVEKLANVLYDAIFESLGLSLNYVKEVVPPIARLIMGVNYYPPCPDPSLTYGISAHSDIGTLTVLLQDDVPGLQIRKDHDWFLVKPLPNAFVINLADQTEILSNGKYKSIEHRAITNTEKPRISVACFFAPDENEIISPLPKFVSESKPALYKHVKFRDYVTNFYSKSLMPNRGTLNLAK